jgi:hypothetical protein
MMAARDGDDKESQGSDGKLCVSEFLLGAAERSATPGQEVEIVIPPNRDARIDEEGRILVGPRRVAPTSHKRRCQSVSLPLSAVSKTVQ